MIPATAHAERDNPWILLILSIPNLEDKSAGSVENPPPYPAFTIISKAITITPKAIEFGPFEIENGISAINVITILLANIILYIVFLSFSLSDIVEYPILPRALNAAVTDGIRLIIVAATAIPANVTPSICFS